MQASTHLKHLAVVDDANSIDFPQNWAFDEVDGYQSANNSHVQVPSRAYILSTDERMEMLEEKLDVTMKENYRLKEKLARVEQKSRDSETSKDELYRRLGELITNMGTLSERIKLLETTTFRTLQAQIEQQRLDFEERDSDMAKLLGNFKEELSRALTASSKLTEEAASHRKLLLEEQRMHQESVTQITNSIREKKLQLDDAQTGRIEAEVKRLVNETLEDFRRAQSASLQDMAKKLEQEIDRRHRRLVESTQLAVSESSKGYETAAPQIRTLQNEMLQVREQLRGQSIQIEAQRTDTSFEHAINEIKEWVQDIERKLITRTEVEDAVLQLNSQLSALKHSYQSTEAVLSQKIELEKNSRESAVSQLASQLLLHGKRK